MTRSRGTSDKIDSYALDGRLLRLFLTIYETNSISRAAAETGLTQSTVSHALERMRVALGDPLFVRKGRGITPTDGAIALVPRMRELVAGYEALTGTLSYEPAADTSTMTLACNVIELTSFLERFRNVVQRMAPGLSLRFVDLGRRDEIAPRLETGNADLVVSVRLDRYSHDLHNALLFTDRHVVYYDPAVRGPVKSLYDYSNAEHGVLDFGGTGHSLVGGALDQVGVRRKPARFISSNSYTLARMMAGTPVLATLPKRLERSSFAGFAHSPPPFVIPPVMFDLIWHRRFDLSARHVWLRKAALQAAGAG